VKWTPDAVPTYPTISMRRWGSSAIAAVPGLRQPQNCLQQRHGQLACLYHPSGASLGAPALRVYAGCPVETGANSQRQSRGFAAALRAAGEPVRLVVAQGYNLFEVNETLANPYGFFGRAVLEQMTLRPA
jgi:hypothetical protein